MKPSQHVGHEIPLQERLVLEPGIRLGLTKAPVPGFAPIPVMTNVPIVMAGLDFKNKRMVLSEPFYPTNNEEKDLQAIVEFFAPIDGKIPAFGMQHLLHHK